jgi:hypothetical protein
MVLLPGCNCCPLIYGFSFRGFRGELHEWNYDTVTPFGRTGISTLPNFPRPTPSLQNNGRFRWYNAASLAAYDPFYAPPPVWYGLVSGQSFGTFGRGGLGRVRNGTKIETEYASTKCRCYVTLTTFSSVTEIVYERDLEYMPDVRQSGIFRFDATHVVEYSNTLIANAPPISRFNSLCSGRIVSPPQFQQSDIGEVTLFRDKLITPGFVEAGQTLSVEATLGEYQIPANQGVGLFDTCDGFSVDMSFSSTPKALVVDGQPSGAASFTESNGGTNLYWRKNGDVKEFSAMFFVSVMGFERYYASVNVNEILWRLYSEDGTISFSLSPNEYAPLPGVHGPGLSTGFLQIFDSFGGDFSYTVTAA